MSESEQAPNSELVALRIPVPDLRELRLAARAEAGGNVSEMIRVLCREGIERRIRRDRAA
jgi:hypothetical protein